MAQAATHADVNQQHPKLAIQLAYISPFHPLRFRLSQMFVWQALLFSRNEIPDAWRFFLEQISMDLSRFSFVISFAFYDEIVDSDPLTFGRIAFIFLKLHKLC